MTGAIEVWRGGVNAWECDEMGHLNVRHYVAKWSEALGATALAAGLPRAFAKGAGSTILPLDQHIRFLAEARAGAPLSMTGGVVEIAETEAVLLHEMRHADARPAATFLTRVVHVEARSGKPFPWSDRTRQALAALRCAPPPHAQPRSIDLRKAPCAATRAEAERLGAPVTGRVMVGAHDLDAAGRMRPELFIGRISDSVPNLLARWREDVGRLAGAEAPAGGAVLEYRLIYRRWPEAGDFMEVRSGLAEVMEKTQRVVHWLIDPITGEAWATAEAVVVNFDLKTRKAITPAPEIRAALAAQAIPDFSI